MSTRPTILYTLVDDTLPPPARATEGAAGLDLVARETVHVAPGDVGKIPLNVKVQPPDGFATLLIARSSLCLKHGLMVANSVGLIDRDFTAEVALLVTPIGGGVVTVERGARVAQLVLVADHATHVLPADLIANAGHLGFGSTGERALEKAEAAA